MQFLTDLQLSHDIIAQPGGSKSKITASFEQAMSKLGWRPLNNNADLFEKYPEEHRPLSIPFHKGSISVHWAWHSKNNLFYKFLHDIDYFYKHKRLHFSYIVTRSESLLEYQKQTDPKRYATTTTNLGFLSHLLDYRDTNTCPIVGLGIKRSAIS